jgi:hypothetical protein
VYAAWGSTICSWNARIGTGDSSPSGYQSSEGVECIFPNCNVYLASQNEHEDVKWWAFANNLTNGPHLTCLTFTSPAHLFPVSENPEHVLEGPILEYTAWGVHWTIGGRRVGSLTQLGKPPLFSDREAGEAGWQEVRSRNAQHATRVLDLVHNLSSPTYLNPQQQIMSGLEIAGIVLAIPSTLHLINLTVLAIKDVCCGLASAQS